MSRAVPGVWDALSHRGGVPRLDLRQAGPQGRHRPLHGFRAWDADTARAPGAAGRSRRDRRGGVGVRAAHCSVTSHRIARTRPGHRPVGGIHGGDRPGGAPWRARPVSVLRRVHDTTGRAPSRTQCPARRRRRHRRGGECGGGARPSGRCARCGGQRPARRRCRGRARRAPRFVCIRRARENRAARAKRPEGDASWPFSSQPSCWWERSAPWI